MKNYLCVPLCAFMLMVAVSGCSSKPSDIQAEYLMMLDEPASPQSILNVGNFLDKNLKKFDAGQADQMVIAYEDYIYSFDGEDPDYREFSDRYRKYVSAPMANLFDIKQYEQENPMTAGDAQLRCSWMQLAERALNLEVFIKENKSYQLVRDEAVRIYEYYIRAMLMGTSGTPIFEQNSGDFKGDAQNAYAEVAAAYPDTTVALVINEYFEYLESAQFKHDYRNSDDNTVFSDTCAYLVSEAGKRAMQR